MSAVKVTIVVDNTAKDGLASEHGFAAWIEVAGRRLLFDTGQGPALPGNASKLSIDLRATDILVLSHGHYDHTGGVPLVVELAPAVQVYLHPAATGPRYSVHGGSARAIGMPEATRLVLENPCFGGVHWVRRQLELAAGAGITGPIPRLTDFEVTGGPFFIDAGGTLSDSITDDLALWIRTERGLVVIVGCSHAGLINTLRYARRLSGESRVHAVVGGFHMAGASERRLQRTMDSLKELDLDMIVPCHCTGGVAVERLRENFGERVVPGLAGAAYMLGTARGVADGTHFGEGR